MDVPIPYLINDTRKAEFLKKTTFSHYLKKDVLDTLYKKIDEGKTSEMCLWLSECIASGYLEELWERAVLYYVKYINVNSPLVPYHFYRKLVHILKLKQQEHFQKYPLKNSASLSRTKRVSYFPQLGDIKRKSPLRIDISISSPSWTACMLGWGCKQGASSSYRSYKRILIRYRYGKKK